MRAEIDVESLAVSTVTKIISKTGYLVPCIPTKDRGPSFDGCILVYGHKGIDHEKSDMKGRVDVQVKGCTLQAPEVTKISYPIDVSDLQNFLNAGGVMFLVVSFDLQGDHEQVYYSRLLPFELKQLLKDCTEEQKTKSVSLTPMPKDRDEISDLFINFVRNYNLQRAYVGSSFVIDGDKVKKEDFGELTFGFASVQNQSKPNYDLPLKYLFTHGTYLYKNIGYDVQMPVEYMEKIDVIFSERPGAIEAGDKIFYRSFNRVIFTDHEEIRIGKSHRLIYDRANKSLKYKYKLTGSLKERLYDEKFLIKMLQTKEMGINGHVIPLNVEDDETGKRPDLRQLQKHVEWLEKVDKALQLVHAKEDLDCEILSDKDERKIHLLIDGIVEKKKVSLNIEDSTFCTISFGNLNLLICALRRNDDGKFNLFGYYDAPVVFKGVMADGTEFDSTYFLMLTKDEMIGASNIDLPVIIKNIKKIAISPAYINHMTLFLLELIKVYDETNDDEYYDTALKLCDWLKKKDTNKESAIHTINSYQLLKRKNNLSEKQLANLRKIAKDNTDLSLKVGAYILLGEEDKAKETYARLDETTKQSFRDYPICIFCKGLITK